MNRQRLLLIALTSLACLIVSDGLAGSKKLLVRYRPWFVAKPYSEIWGWHWTMDRFDPDHIDAAGQRQVASWYRPLIGPYDSADPAVLEYHVLLMKLSGIDGLIVDWYGPDDYLDYALNNERTSAIFSHAATAGLDAVLCYEDQVIQQQIDGGYLEAANAVARAQEAILYVQRHYFQSPNYLRWRERPVLLNFGPQYFEESSQWESIFSVLEPTNQPAFYTEDHRLDCAVGAFNWPPMWLSHVPGTRGVLSRAALQKYLSEFEEKGADWPSFISSAFPRFHDVYKFAGVRDYWGYLGDHGGQTFRHTLTRALTNSSAMVQIVTWNDFAEGTMVEPTVEYGFRDLGIIQEHRRLHLDAGFAYTTNDLEIPLRLYHLRRASSTNVVQNADLDCIANEILKGNLEAATLALDEMELTTIGAQHSTDETGP